MAHCLLRRRWIQRVCHLPRRELPRSGWHPGMAGLEFTTAVAGSSTHKRQFLTKFYLSAKLDNKNGTPNESTFPSPKVAYFLSYPRCCTFLSSVSKTPGCGADRRAAIFSNAATAPATAAECPTAFELTASAAARGQKEKSLDQ